jgi:hypothetical protein
MENSNPTRGISEAEMHAYVAADAAMTSTKPWVIDVTSKRMKLYAILMAVATLAVHIFLAIVVNVGDTGTTVTRIDQWGYLGVGIVLAVVFYLGISRPRVRANEDGVDIRNFIGSRFYPWQVIYGLYFPEGARMPRLELPEFEYVPMWGMQAADGKQTIEAVAKFRELEAKYMPED